MLYSHTKASRDAFEAFTCMASLCIWSSNTHCKIQAHVVHGTGNCCFIPNADMWSICTLQIEEHSQLPTLFCHVRYHACDSTPSAFMSHCFREPYADINALMLSVRSTQPFLEWCLRAGRGQAWQTELRAARRSASSHICEETATRTFRWQSHRLAERRQCVSRP